MENLAQDDRVKNFFKSVDFKKHQGALMNYLIYLFGGPNGYFEILLKKI